MNILIFNWRDIKNPDGGGAEILTHEIAKRWVRWGHTVVQFSAQFKGATDQEVIDGVNIIRRGSSRIRTFSIPVHLAAYIWYIRNRKMSFDIVIDEIHGIPFFIPWYVSAKKVAFICEVASEIWNVAFVFPFNILGRSIERLYFYFYRHIPFLTISPSTKKELLAMGLSENMITVLPMGVNLPKRTPHYPKENEPTLIFVARLTKAKGVEEAIEVASLVKEKYPKVHLWIVGQGNDAYQDKIARLVQHLALERTVKFFGYVDQRKKFELMSRAHMLIVPSLKEGWGLTVPEAGYVGTPSVAYDVEGLRDVIRQEETGMLVRPSPLAMSKEVIHLFADSSFYKDLQQKAKRLSLTYSWDVTARVGLSLLERVIRSYHT